MKSLPIPSFFDSANAEVWGYSPDIAQLNTQAAKWRTQHNFRPAATDKKKVQLLVIDGQNDFVHPNGTLFVGGRSGRGAIDDTARTAEFIYRNLGVISSIRTTLDTHFAHQVFFTDFWMNGNNQAPAPFSTVTVDDVQQGELSVNPAMAGLLTNGNYNWLQSYALHYVQELEKAGKYELTLWPYHCLLGGPGHNLSGILHEARMFHSFARFSQSLSEIKGGNPLTENYSVLRPEVLTTHDGRSVDQKNTFFLESLLENDIVVVVGQAGSHCVKSSVVDLLEEILAKDPNLAGKVYVVADCMSAVTVPDGNGGFLADYTDDMNDALKRYANEGMHVVDSTSPIESWPGIQL